MHLRENPPRLLRRVHKIESDGEKSLIFIEVQEAEVLMKINDNWIIHFR